METLIIQLRSATGWDESLIDSLMDAVRGSLSAGTISEDLQELSEAAADGGATPQLRFAFTLMAALDGTDPIYAERLAATLENLNQQGEWAALGRLAIGIADLAGDPGFCRYVARAGEEGSVDVLPEGTLDRALELAPDSHRLLWLKGTRLADAGEGNADSFFAAAAPGWARAKAVERVEEAILQVIETPDADHWEQIWDAVTHLAKHGEPKPLNSFLEMGMEHLAPLGMLDTVWDSLRRLMEIGQSTRKIRAFATTVATHRHRSLASIEQILERSGLGNSDVPAKTALKEYDRLLKFAPGLLVIHQGFGAGTIKDNDGDSLVIDFDEKSGHRMSLSIAERSLDILPPDDLMTKILTDLDGIKTMAKKDPVELLSLALVKAGGEASSADVRKQLVPRVMSAQSWPAWWKRATTAAKDDARIDTSQTFRRVYRVADAAGDASLLPPIQERSDLHQNLEMIHHFLIQHPEAESEARRVYRPRLAQWLGTSQRHEARVHILAVLRRWDRGLDQSFREELRELLAAGGDFSFTSLDVEQMELVDVAHDMGLTMVAALAAFPSRHENVRRHAAELLGGEPPDEVRRFVRELFSRSPQDANRILGLVEFAVSAPDAVPVAIEDPWFALRALIAIIHGAAKEPPRRQALAQLKLSGPFVKVLADHPIDDEGHQLLVTQLTSWRTTDRLLFPILDFIEMAGARNVVEEVHRDRSEKSAEFVVRGDADEGEAGIFMTRAGMERLRDEILELETALKTTLPATIRRAMELGDLKENAEYHAAKDKQRQFGQRVQQLQQLISQARAIEEMALDDTVAGPGREVVTEDLADGSTHTYWILGEGDTFLGNDVISYRAPLGAALRGHKVGDEVTVPLEDGPRRLRIVSVARRLPQPTS